MTPHTHERRSTLARWAGAGAAFSLTLALAIGAAPAPAAHAVVDPWAPVCTTPASPQVITAGVPTRLRAICKSIIPRALTVSGVHGTGSISSAGIITYTADAGWTGPDRISVVLPLEGTPGLETRFLIDVHALPRVADDTYIVTGGESLGVAADGGLLANDTVTDGDGWMIQQGATPPKHGSLEVDTISGAVNYTPDPDFIGTDSIVYRLTGPDDGTYSSIAHVTFHVTETPSPGTDGMR